MIPCPDCHATGQAVADHVLYADGRSGYDVRMRCSRCQGTGQVDGRTPEWIALGRRMRNARVLGKPYRTQREEAAPRGLTCVEISRMEQGYCEPIPGPDFEERERSISAVDKRPEPS